MSHPQSLGKYQIEGVLGKGAMGVVYKGFDPNIARQVAIKTIHASLLDTEMGRELLDRFRNEAQAVGRLNHANIVAIYEFDQDHGTPYFVMEYVEGHDLKTLLKEGREFNSQDTLHIIGSILQALQYTHKLGIVHRDIKPANIILLENGEVKVSDFGVARLDTSDLTSTGFMVGTPNYMSPEGLLGQQVDGRSDIFSTAVLFFELLTRDRPSKELNVEQNLEKLNTMNHLSGENVLSIKPILRKALQPNPDQRFQSAREFIDGLKSIKDMDLTLATTAHFPRPQNYQAVAPQEPNAFSSSQWSDDLLNSLEQSLARYVGPMAKLLVKKNSRSSTSIEQLVANLTQHIPNENERSQFMKAMEKTGISKAGLSSTSMAKSISVHDQPTQISDNAISEAQLKSLANALAFYVGPLSSRLVKKYSQTYSTLPELAQALSQQIPDDQERSQFLSQAGKL